jgi:hypothetical protein
MMDFTLDTYKKLLSALREKGYPFQTFASFLEKPLPMSVILRHDIDDRKENSLHFARIQHEWGICGTYYFRVVPCSFDQTIIREIAGLGHEIGYHYEDMDIANGDASAAIRHFEQQLRKFRELFPVKTICMHGSPLSPFDNKTLWEHYRFEDFGIIGEPYFSLDFNRVLYLTDTGRRWNGAKVSVRDKVKSGFSYDFRTTGDIIRELNRRGLPAQVMITFHPQRWSDTLVGWTRELVMQNVKNMVKKTFYARREVRKSV